MYTSVWRGPRGRRSRKRLPQTQAKVSRISVMVRKKPGVEDYTIARECYVLALYRKRPAKINVAAESMSVGSLSIQRHEGSCSRFGSRRGRLWVFNGT